MEHDPSHRPVWQDPRAIALLMAASLTTMANATISPALPGLERLFADDPNLRLRSASPSARRWSASRRTSAGGVSCSSSGSSSS